ncbi:MAG: hypothetical protein IT556_14085 [Acetobacteraceae bacterium]|nr:hypothetical protein [Acetobacteraceae bacterium]
MLLDRISAGFARFELVASSAAMVLLLVPATSLVGSSTGLRALWHRS